MTLLNFVYFIMGILTLNKGLAIATFSFVVYILKCNVFLLLWKKIIIYNLPFLLFLLLWKKILLLAYINIIII